MPPPNHFQIKYSPKVRRSYRVRGLTTFVYLQRCRSMLHTRQAQLVRYPGYRFFLFRFDSPQLNEVTYFSYVFFSPRLNFSPIVFYTFLTNLIMTLKKLEELQLKLLQSQKRISELEEALAKQSDTDLVSTIELASCDSRKEELEQSRNKYRKLFNYANDAMFVISLDKNSPNYGFFSDVNNVACKRLGYTREELLQKTPFDISDGNDFLYNKQLIVRLNKDGNATFETIYVRKDGTHFPVEINALRLTIDGEDLYMAIARDITERKQAEEDLQKSAQLYRLLADNVHDIIWTTDNTLTPRYVSPSFSHLTGFPKEDAISSIHHEIILSSPFKNDINQLFTISEDQPLHWESEIKTKDQRMIWVESIASPLPASSNQFTGIIGVTRDITSRKKIMLELEQAKEQAFGASRAKSKFLANMSHEVRTPMNGVIGMLQLLKMTSLNDEQLEYVETASISGESLLTIINDILDFSKIEADKFQMTPEPFEIRVIVKTLITSFKNSINPRNVKLRYSVNPEVPEILIADQVRIRQILYNLVGNAVKFTEHGEINVTIRMLEVIDKTLVRLEGTVSDTGIGIPKDIGDKLFQPFTQIESPRQKKIQGTGLGLSIVKQLVVQMGGEVHLARNKHQGTTATFTLEVTKGRTLTPRDKTPAPTPILTSPNRRLSTLVVEDELINQQILLAILTKFGHKTTLASDGHTALKLLESNVYDIILMDVQMPELDGIETTKIIRTSKQYAHVKNIPIVALTAYAMTGDEEKCLKSGMNSYLSKPVDVKALDKLMKTLTSES